MNFWRWLMRPQKEAWREMRRDPDLDLVKHMAEDHEYRIQLMERDLERISGGTGQKFSDRRTRPRGN